MIGIPYRDVEDKRIYYIRYKRRPLAMIASDTEMGDEDMILPWECPRSFERYGRDLDARGYEPHYSSLPIVDDDGLIELIEGKETVFGLTVDGEPVCNITLMHHEREDASDELGDQYPLTAEMWMHLDLAEPFEGLRVLTDEEALEAVEEALGGDGE